jgi:hypothetical protein
MRFTAIAVLVISASGALAQADLWSHVRPQFDLPQLSAATLSDSRLVAIRRLMRENTKSIGWECSGDQLDEMLKGLTFENIPLSDGHDVLLVQAGAGCARGGQGSNGAMWLVRFEGDTPLLMATPKDGFNGWLFSIQPSTSHGFRDIVLGWHMGARVGGLNYLRFDGKSYQPIASASYTVDDDDNLNIVPNPK